MWYDFDCLNLSDWTIFGAGDVLIQNFELRQQNQIFNKALKWFILNDVENIQLKY